MSAGARLAHYVMRTLYCTLRVIEYNMDDLVSDPGCRDR